MPWFNPEDPNLKRLKELDPSLLALMEPRDSGARLLEELPRRYRADLVMAESREQQAWEDVGLVHLRNGRMHEALAIFLGLYQHMLAGQTSAQRVHKGMPLLWISESFYSIGFPVHAKRYLMLALCEDALRGNGEVAAESTGAYFRLVWRHGLSDRELRRYASEFWSHLSSNPEAALYPEALLQRVDDRWVTEIPSPAEAFFYVANESYVRWLTNQLGESSGHALEWLADYLLSCMPGCRTKRRQRSAASDYDVVCSMEGLDLDFRSELGRYFVCECKDWRTPADFTSMAKFCRVLDSTKAKFGILFSKSGLSGQGRTEYAEREQLKVYQDRGIVIVVLSLSDLESVANGANLISLLRERYEAVRLDVPGSRNAD